MQNLDFIAAKTGQKIVNDFPGKNDKDLKELKNCINKSLGILQESGVNALFLFLLAKRNKQSEGKHDPYRAIIKGLLLKEKDERELLFLPENDWVQENGIDNQQKVLEFINKVTRSNIFKLMLFREYLLRSLTYARYTADAKEVEIAGEKSGDGER
ncbi:hypothetical protein ciss_05430 [Carboxydothermus islandicus]|uniref:CRISPR type III-B/RAMP module-associated protein Cmr5 n=1 Tax=Carboxydothermus islandicus TaxID=661089 RepID=A0A1L8D0A7_9THEO|nr:hypothetical protein [Carboxydothermus islandicus]GAV24610.1 hypothetical protein ciss_05430 [Carboxydothermus islandicus]